jgi:hypothetical protein
LNKTAIQRERATGLTAEVGSGQAAPVKSRVHIHMAWAASIAVGALSGWCAGAETPCFRIEGLKYIETVHLDVTGSRANGDYLIDEYGQNAKRFQFSGNVIPTPAGKSGVYLAIAFNKEDLGEGQQAPYQLPPGTKQIVWVLRIVNHRAHLFISINERFYDTVPAHYAVAELEYLPCK